MKILFFVTEDWYFCSHRLSLARAVHDAGHDVIVVTRVRDHGEIIRRSGLSLIPFDCQRGGVNPFAELLAVFRLIRVYRSVRPDLVHHVAMKPVLYGSIAALACRVPRVVNALTGLGWLFSSTEARARALKRVMQPLLGRLLRRGTVIVQNSDDNTLVRSLGIDDVRLIQGSGVDAEKFSPTVVSQGKPVVMLVARLLLDKGIEEFANAARILKSRGVSARFVLVGASDPENPSSVPPGLVEAWVTEGILEQWGRRDNMPDVLAQAQIACLPSYREGLPKSLLEAAACGLPIVTTNVPGCREIVRDGQNGFLVPARDHLALADALQVLIEDRELRRRMGERGRSMILERFTEKHVITETLRVYKEFDESSPRHEASGAGRC